MTRRLAVVLALAFVVSCVPPTASPSPSATPTPSGSPLPSVSAAAGTADMSAVLLANLIPEANIFDLTRRLRGQDGKPAGPFQPVRTTPPDETVGTSREFWTYDFATKKNMHVSATIRTMTDHAKWWVENGVTVDDAALRTSASFFETKIYPTDRGAYGEEWSPGIDGDVHVNIMVARIPGAAAGYFNSSDELPLWVNQFSAEREMVYINALAARAGSMFLNIVVAHEFCHMIQFNKRKRSSGWFNEGQAQLCEVNNGFPVQHAQTFLRAPDTQLNDWPELEQSQPHYGVTYLFLEFLRQQAGGDDLINAFMAKGIDTPADLDAVLRARGKPPLEELFGDFVAANALLGTSTDRRYSYPNGVSYQPATAVESDRVAVGGGVFRSAVHSYAARYIELPRASFKLHFEGARQSRVIPTDPHGGKYLWWSDRVDSLDSRMTRTVDLRSAAKSTLSFWTWFEIEKDYDYAYVAVSTDGGQRWTTLPSSATTSDDPNGDNLGNGYTGTSGGSSQPAWIKQEMDLSAYAGKEVQLRFEYVTDAATNLHGFAVDDIEISGGVFSDDAESDRGWHTEGFVRSTNVVAQRFLVQVLRFTDRGALVERHAVDAGTLDLDLNTTGDRKPPLLAVTGYAVRTTQPAAFEVTLR